MAPILFVGAGVLLGQIATWTGGSPGGEPSGEAQGAGAIAIVGASPSAGPAIELEAAQRRIGELTIENEQLADHLQRLLGELAVLSAAIDEAELRAVARYGALLHPSMWPRSSPGSRRHPSLAIAPRPPGSGPRIRPRPRNRAASRGGCRRNRRRWGRARQQPAARAASAPGKERDSRSGEAMRDGRASSDDRSLGMHPLVREFLALEPEPLDLTSLVASEREEDWIELARAIGRRRAIAEARQDELAWRILFSPAARQSAVDACLAWDIAARHVRGRAVAEESRATSALYVALEHADEAMLRRLMEQISPRSSTWEEAAGPRPRGSSRSGQAR